MIPHISQAKPEDQAVKALFATLRGLSSSEQQQFKVVFKQQVVEDFTEVVSEKMGKLYDRKLELEDQGFKHSKPQMIQVKQQMFNESEGLSPMDTGSVDAVIVHAKDEMSSINQEIKQLQTWLSEDKALELSIYKAVMKL